MGDFIKWLRRNCDRVEYSTDTHFGGVYLGHKVRYNASINKVDVGNKDFDRWANSVAYTFDLEKSGYQKQMNLAIDEARKDTRGPWERSFQKMAELAKESNYV